MVNLSYIVFIVAAIFAAFGSILSLWVVYRYPASKSDSNFVAQIFWLIGLSAILVEAFSTRSPALVTTMLDESGGLTSTPSAVSSLLGRLSSIFFVCLALIHLFLRVLKQKSNAINLGERFGDPAGGLFLSYLTFFLGGGVLSSILGTKPSFVHWMFYPLALIGAAYFSNHLRTEIVAENAKRILMLLVYSSLIAAVLFPSFAYESGYRGLIPGLDIRLYGLSAHPNTLGPTALLFLVVEFYYPSRGVIRYLNFAVGTIVFFLAQSKTGYVALIVVLFVIFWYYMPSPLRVAGRFSSRVNFLVGILLTSAVVGLILLALNIGGIDFSGNPFSYLAPQELKYLSTLTGRTIIWDITLEEWRRNPFFGYGPTIWYPEFREKHGLLVVGQAHNQFVQALGESGLFGFAGLLIYIFFLLKSALKTAKFSRGFSLALVMIPLSRTWTETPFRNFVVNDWAFFLHLFVVCMLICLLRNSSRSEVESGIG